MKYLLFPFVLLLIAFGNGACEKVVNAKLNTAATKYVIEGIVNNSSSDTCTIWVSTTSSFTQSNSFHGVSGAVVQVADNNGLPVTLTEQYTGVYQSLLVKGMPGHTYALKVVVNGEIYTAACKMPESVGFDSLFVSRQNIAGKNVYLANAIYADPPGISNYYNFVEYVNRERIADLYLTSDNLSDGSKVQFSLYNNTELKASDKIKSRDTLEVEMQCIDAAIYKYLYSLNAGASGSDVLATPANPVTNIQGDVLGYFSANTSFRKHLVVP